MDLYVVSVFNSGNALRGGNPLAVFPDAGELSGDQMQAIAATLNLSETTFVSGVTGDSYEVRIFTPREELPFAGHPTIGTSWVLSHLDRIEGDSFVQRSGAGETRVTRRGDRLWFLRHGEASSDIEERHPQVLLEIARAVGLEPEEIGLEAREMGRSGRLGPAFSSAGLEQLMVPVRDAATLARCSPRADLLRRVTSTGAYCFTAVGAGRLRSRGFFAPLGIDEDPATGSAAAALGLYLAARVGAADLEVVQGAEMGRPSRILLKAGGGRVEVGGTCDLILQGRLERLP